MLETLAAPAIVAAVVGALVTLGLNTLARRRELRDRKAKHRQEQLANLYIPLVFARRESQTLRKLLPDQDAQGNRWRLVDNIKFVQHDGTEEQRAAVERVLELWEEISRLLAAHGGLLLDLPPDRAYTDALEHASHLRVSWSRGSNQIFGETRFPFPETLDAKIDSDIKQIVNDLRRLGITEPPVESRTSQATSGS